MTAVSNSIFSHRWLRNWLGAQFVAYVSTWGLLLAETWLAYLMTSSPAVLGLATLFGWSPVLLLAPIAGQLIDKHGAVSVLKQTQLSALAIGLLLAVLQLTGALSLVLLLALTLARGIVAAIDAPARRTLLLTVTSETPALRPGALTALLALHQTGRLVALAGIGAFLGNGLEALCFLMCSAGFLPLYWQLRKTQDGGLSQEGGQPATFRDVLDYAWTTHALRRALVPPCLFALTAAAYGILLPDYAKASLGLSVAGLALLAGATTVGALLAFAHSQRPVLDLPTSSLPYFIVCSTVITLLGATKNMALVAVLLVLAGAAQTLATTKAISAAQELVPPPMRSRFNSVMVAIEAGVPAIVALVVGLAGANASTTYLVLGLLSFSLLLLAGRKRPPVF